MKRLGRAVACVVGLVACSWSAASISDTAGDAGSYEQTGADAAVVAPAPVCPPPDGSEPRIDFAGAPLSVLCHTIYTEPATPLEQRELLKQWYGEALTELANTFGPAKDDPPAVVVCATKDCQVAFSGPTRRSHATMTPRPTIFISGIGALTKGTMVHEMTHIAIARKRMATPSPTPLPAWFEEGVATFVGNNAYCPPGTTLAIDDLRRLRSPRVWTNFTNQKGKLDPTYCQAHDEIAAWVKARGGKALVATVDSVIAGSSFEDLYGPLLLAGAANPDTLEGHFSFDENAGLDVSDQAGHHHAASLVSGATWTTGYRGGAVNVSAGAHVRTDGFVDFGLPDRPFSIALWVKPQVNANVLVHSAVNAGGGDGWCLPVLGHDATGHLVAQVNFAGDPNSFLIATGPVLPTNVWSHVVMTWNAKDGVRLYVNGVLGAQAVPASADQRHRDVPGLPMFLLFGSDNGASCWEGGVKKGSWDGALDESRIYNHALSSSQVVADMKQ